MKINPRQTYTLSEIPSQHELLSIASTTHIENLASKIVDIETGAAAGGCGCGSPPVAGPPVAGPPVPLKRRRWPTCRGQRRPELWGDAGHFALSQVWHRTTLTAQSAQCRVPGHKNCNKTVTVGQNFNGDEARRLIMQWCIDGIALTNREDHMKIKPRQTYTLSEIPSQHELLELVNGQTLA